MRCCNLNSKPGFPSRRSIRSLAVDDAKTLNPPREIVQNAIHPFRQSTSRAGDRAAQAQNTRRERRKMRVSCLRVIGPAKQMFNKRGPPGGFALRARALLFLVARPLKAMLEKHIPIGYQDETGFHYGSIRGTQPSQPVSPHYRVPPAPKHPSVDRLGEPKDPAPL